MPTANLGLKGEKIAAEYLVAKGYKVLHTNWHWIHKELDIVTMFNGRLVVVEVKTRENNYWEEPKEAVRKRKQKNIIDAADAYVNKYNYECEVQFDIISIVWNNGQYKIEHIEDAFYPTL